MEAGIIALLLLLGYNVIDNETDNQPIKENKEEIVQKFEGESDFKYEIVGNIDQRFFENKYQLQLKQYHYEGNQKIADSINHFSINSSDMLVYKNKFNDTDEFGNEIENSLKFKTQLLIDKLKEGHFLNYKIDYKEVILNSKNNNSKFEMTLEDKLNVYLDKKIIINYKNFQYELKLKDLGKSEIFKNVESLDCQNNITCEILKENTIHYKKTLNQNVEFVSKIEKRKQIKEFDVEKDHVKQFNKNRTLTFNDYLIHKVKKGDTLLSISLKYNVPIKLIKSLNDINSNNIFINQELVIVNKSTILHKINYGDNLYKLSKEYNKSVNEIKKLNGLKNNIIQEGRFLIISL